jgi:hypothetical protein
VRTLLAIAIVSAVVVSGKAQAPASIPGPTIEASSTQGIGITEVRVLFADGSVIRADSMVRADKINANRFRSSRTPRTLEMFEDGEWKPVPAPTEFILSGDVRLRMGGR